MWAAPFSAPARYPEPTSTGMSVTEIDNLEGSSLGKYQIVRRIGAGNMATVYMGHDPFIDRPVAVKVAKPDPSGDGEASE